MNGYDDVKTVEECTQMGIVDSCDEYEQANGWFHSLSDVFCEVKKVKMFGDDVKFQGFDLFFFIGTSGIVKW